MRPILYTDELARELLKLPRMPICVGLQDSKTLSDDRQILNTYLRSDGTCVLNYDNFPTNGELRFYRRKQIM